MAHRWVFCIGCYKSYTFFRIFTERNGLRNELIISKESNIFCWIRNIDCIIDENFNIIIMISYISIEFFFFFIWIQRKIYFSMLCYTQPVCHHIRLREVSKIETYLLYHIKRKYFSLSTIHILILKDIFGISLYVLIRLPYFNSVLHINGNRIFHGYCNCWFFL